MSVPATSDVPAVTSAVAGAQPGIMNDVQDEKGSLPVVGLLGLVGSAGFAVWTSLTCFVC